jgi:hypothetical protein
MELHDNMQCEDVGYEHQGIGSGNGVSGEVKQRGVPFAIIEGDGVIMARFRVTLNSQYGWDATKITYCNTVQEAGQE